MSIEPFQLPDQQNLFFEKIREKKLLQHLQTSK